VKKAGAKRRALLIRLVPPGRSVIDVGADHGHVAQQLGAVATERLPTRAGKTPVQWVIADGLAPFRHVDVAIIAGMGAHTIMGILGRGPRPSVAVLHAQDDPPALRIWLAANGWRIDAEGLAPEARRFAEVIRVVPGTEAATGLELEFGPRLLEGGDPHLAMHLQGTCQRWSDIARATSGRAPDKHLYAATRVSFLNDAMKQLSAG